MKFYEDTLENIWSNLRLAPVYNPLSDTFPSIYAFLIFTAIHLLLDFAFNKKAHWYASKEIQIIEPNILLSSPSIALQTLHKRLKKCQSKKAAEKWLKKFTETLSKVQRMELQSYSSSLISHSKHVSKFKEAVFKVICFGFVYFDGLYLLFMEGDQFFWDQKLMWINCCPQSCSSTMKFWLTLQLGYHLHRALFQLFEHKRRDFIAMFIHHWVTCILLWRSWMMGYVQMGATVLLCNDNMDLLMPCAKLCEYLGFKKSSLVFTAVFAALWIPFRIFLYFYKVLWNIAIDGYDEVRLFYSCWVLFIGLLVIYLLQFYWTKFLLEMMYRKIVKGYGSIDGRSDESGAESGMESEKMKKDQ